MRRRYQNTWRILNRGLWRGRDLFGRRKDGGEVPVEIGLNPLRTGEGTFVLAAIIDITERKRAEVDRERYAAELERSNRELDQFAYVASHDLKEPLRMIANYSQLLQEEYSKELDDTACRYIHYAVDGA